MYKLNCFVDEMLVGTIVTSVIPRVGESISVKEFSEPPLANKIWSVLHVNYDFSIHHDDTKYMHVDNLHDVNITLAETQVVDEQGFFRKQG